MNPEIIILENLGLIILQVFLAVYLQRGFKKTGKCRGIKNTAVHFPICGVGLRTGFELTGKKRGVIERGGKVVEYDRVNEDRDRIARGIAEEKCAAFVPPFDDFHIIAGQGTAGLEIAEDLREKHTQPDALLVPCSGGGLIAGCATALNAHFPQTRIYAVEPEGFDDHRRSLEAGARRKNDRMDGSICDALLAAEPGQLTFQINRKLLSGAIAANDDDVRRAMAYAILSLKLVSEPGGAIALAAVLSGRFDAQGKTVVLVMSGGNADKTLICDVLGANGAAAQQ